MAEEEPLPAPWYILHRAAHVRHDATTTVDNPDRLLSLDLPLDDEPPSISRLTALTRRKAAEAPPPPPPSQPRAHPSNHHLVIVANDEEELLLHVSGSPYGFNLDPSGGRGTFFVARQHKFWAVPAATSPDGRNAFDITAERQPNREGGLSSFSGFNNVGLLRRRDRDGSFVIAELQANQRRHHDLTVPLITFRSDEKNGWGEAHLHWGVVDDEDSPHWTTHGVIAHDGKLWWVNLSRGLVFCNPAPSQDLEPRLEFVPLPPVLPELLDNKLVRPPESIDRYRIVKASAGKIRFVDVARSRAADPGREEETRVVVWTLADMPPTGLPPQWENHPCQTTLANIWANPIYVEKGMPREVPVLALLHPTEPAVVYFFLNQHIFSVDVEHSTVVDHALMTSVPPPINQHDVLAWVRPGTKFKTRLVHEIDDSRYPVITEEPDTDSQDSQDVAPAEGGQQPWTPSTDNLTGEDECT